MGKTEGASNRDMLTVKKKEMFILMTFLYSLKFQILVSHMLVGKKRHHANGTIYHFGPRH